MWESFPPLKCGGNSRRAIHLSSRAREFRWMSARARRGSDEDRISREEIRSSSCHFRRILAVQSHPPASSFRRNKNPQSHPEASLLVPRESGRGGFESLLEHDSKAQPPVCIHGVSLHIAATRLRTEAGRCRGVWFQSSFVIWRPQQGGMWESFPPLKCGGNSCRAIHLSRLSHRIPMDVRRGEEARRSDLPRRDLIFVISAAPPRRPKPSVRS